MPTKKNKNRAAKSKFRLEHDSLGSMKLPATVYYGIQTARALENFPISGRVLHPALIYAYLLIKYAAAKVNGELKELKPKIAKAIMQAVCEALDGAFANDFVVDSFQAGAGTSTNMNVNEVLANRACEILGGAKGDVHLISPNDHVNCAQSTNDTFPAAFKIAALTLEEPLQKTLQEFAAALDKKAREFKSIVKAGRTHMQDAVPITLGREFKAYASAVRQNAVRIKSAFATLRVSNLGATAVGTGLNANPKYARLMVRELNKLTNLKLKNPDDFVAITQNMSDFSHASGALKNFALDLIKIANDLRLLSSGPMTGFNEITLPAVQPGSSIMPGKVNPVMAEMLNMVAFQVVANDFAIGLAVQAGQLELNVMMPLMARNLLESLALLNNALGVFTHKCVVGITAHKAKCRKYAEESLALVTVLAPHIGYLKAADLAKIALKENKSILQKVRESGVLTPKQLKKLLTIQHGGC